MHKLTVSPSYPDPFSRLADLCGNLYWTWNPKIREFLRSIDPVAWSYYKRDPIRTLGSVPSARYAELAQDASFMEQYHAALAELDGYKNAAHWYSRTGRSGETIAYLSAEFGLHESVPLYSGGLGVLSGDHAKAASDLGLPLVCVSLMYQKGYFRQHISHDGVQSETYVDNDPAFMPMESVLNADGSPLVVAVEFPNATVWLRVWKMDVGTIPIYLLDTNIPENTIPEYRDIADYLYGGDRQTRIMQEMVLGIGGLRALRAMGIEPSVVHCNEGHSAFLLLERTRMAMTELGMNFQEAAELCASGSVFTTHTPVPAGNDAFPVDMMEFYFDAYRQSLGLTGDEFLALGRMDPDNATEEFSMTVLALKMTAKRNGVSQLHGEVSRKMWNGIWSGAEPDDVPITGITNGVHTHTWIADPIAALFEAQFGKQWKDHVHDGKFWDLLNDVPDRRLWEAKREMRQEMIGYISRRILNSDPSASNLAYTFNPDALTIGFARRFATYKRATLLLSDPERLLRIFGDPDRPVQMLIAGKAHPKDMQGKEYIRRLVESVHELGLHEKIVFIEDYDMALGRMLVQGCDIWLNTPRRPLEASGTSGMKAAINGTLNLSISDGWYPEGYDGNNGFRIGLPIDYNSEAEQDAADAESLYKVLEQQVIPTYYQRNAEELPSRWIAMQRHSIATLLPEFSAERMVRQYAEECYFPCADTYHRLLENNGSRARELARWKEHIREYWHEVSVMGVSLDADGPLSRGSSVPIGVSIRSNAISAESFRVECHCGIPDDTGKFTSMELTVLSPTSATESDLHFTGILPLTRSGTLGIRIRILPTHPELTNPDELGLVIEVN